MNEIINGIQQIGIGVSDTKAVFNWYRKHLGFDILLFQDEATASLMTQYTNGVAQRRDAYLSLNMRGGGGLEIWQFKDRVPNPPKKPVLLGDLGINAMKIKSIDINQTHGSLQKLELTDLSKITQHGSQNDFFHFNDPWGNPVQVVQGNSSFTNTKSASGGVIGAVIGVSDMTTSMSFYHELLGYSKVLVDETLVLPTSINSHGKEKFRRVIISQNREKVGGFGELLGVTQLDLVQALDRKPIKIYKDRLWGDLGYIHICFDVHGMDKLRAKAEAINHPFTVDSAKGFDMGDAAGHFGYVEDPDGTLIELVETHKVPILKAMGLYLNLKKRNPARPLPKWLVKTLSLHRVSKDI
ncbi:VOC family protein [Maribacter aestuarii]|uniref:VOC family protein n=1 Tax=Maribacter aestuarii TaxID=1130723 RepID=UPI00248C6ED2|nr:VOC family protein [Maribacter aestuarii]